MHKSVLVGLLVLGASAGAILWFQYGTTPDAGVVLDYQVDVDSALRREAEEVAAALLLKPPWGDTQCVVTATGPKVEVACPSDVTLEGSIGSFIVHTTAPGTFELRRPPETLEKFGDEAALNAVNVLKFRLEAVNARGTRVRRVGPRGVSVFIPGVRAEKLALTDLARVGRLRFHLVDREGSASFFSRVAARADALTDWPAALDPALKQHPIVANESGVRSTSRAVLEHLVAGQTDPAHDVGYEPIVVDPSNAALQQIFTLAPRYAKQLSAQSGPELEADVTRAYKLVYIFRGQGMGGEHLQAASVGADQFDRPVLQLRFDKTGAQSFFELTRQGTNEMMAIMVDDIVYSAPYIKAPIAGGRVQLELGRAGERGFQEVEAMVAVLRSGTLLAPLRQTGARDVEAIDW